MQLLVGALTLAAMAVAVAALVLVVQGRRGCLAGSGSYPPLPAAERERIAELGAAVRASANT